MNKNLLHNFKKKLNIKNIEKKDQKDIVSDVTISFPIEILKFLILGFISAFFVMLQYADLIKTNNDILRQIYLYTFGLALGDLMILILIGSYLTLFIR
ncbi:UNVERIFIED_CONTAM: hypothetical protein O8I53_11210 [Campylobacter lari]